MKINWIVRMKNPTFWLTAIPALIILIQAIAAVFGFTIDLSGVSDKLIAVVEALFAFLAAIGLVVDHTTKGIGDSDRALEYDEPA